MRVVFLIGNGFDLQNGLPAEYNDYRKWLGRQTVEYLVRETAFRADLIEKIRRMIERRSEIETWSDFEKALGTDFVKEFASLNAEAGAESAIEGKGFIEATIDLRLRELEARSLWLEGSRQKFEESLLSFYKGSAELETEVASMTTSVQSQTAEPVYFDILNFNYTRFVDQLTDSLHGKDLGNFFGCKAKIDSVVHVHSSIKEGGIILGVNDEEQLDAQYRRDQAIKEAFVKPLLCQYVNAYKDKEIAEMINRGTVFCVFGMSVGDSDKRWWDLIARRLASTDDTCIVFYSCEKEEIKDRLYRVCGEQVKEKIDPKIHVLLNGDRMFSGLIESKSAKQLELDRIRLRSKRDTRRFMLCKAKKFTAVGPQSVKISVTLRARPPLFSRAKKSVLSGGKAIVISCANGALQERRTSSIGALSLPLGDEGSSFR